MRQFTTTDSAIFLYFVHKNLDPIGHSGTEISLSKLHESSIRGMVLLLDHIKSTTLAGGTCTGITVALVGSLMHCVIKQFSKHPRIQNREHIQISNETFNAGLWPLQYTHWHPCGENPQWLSFCWYFYKQKGWKYSV